MTVPNMTSTAMVDDAICSDAPLPVQFAEIWHHSRAISPERSLALAVLSQAFFDLRKYRFATRRRQQRLYAEAYLWVASDSRAWPYSFASLCDLLGFEAAAVRDRLLDLGDLGGSADSDGGEERTNHEAAA